MNQKLSSTVLQGPSMSIIARLMNVCLLMVNVMGMGDLYIVMVHIIKAIFRRIRNMVLENMLRKVNGSTGN